VDAGADLILAHHAHILKGIEVYRGKTIFHGLCNFVTVVKHLTEDPSKGPQQWAKRRKELFGFEPDPEYPNYPFHPEAKHTLIAKCIIEDGKIIRVSYLPCFINKKGQPEILKKDERGQQVFDYMNKITRGANLDARYAWEEDEVLILAP
jgi:poly-gamma-glutamate synthesis protein (capsule biosynthesis protein)